MKYKRTGWVRAGAMMRRSTRRETVEIRTDALPGLVLRASTLPVEPPVESAITRWLEQTRTCSSRFLLLRFLAQVNGTLRRLTIRSA